MPSSSRVGQRNRRGLRGTLYRAWRDRSAAGPGSLDAGQSVSEFWLLSVTEEALDVREQST
jgi:hypothetical protein